MLLYTLKRLLLTIPTLIGVAVLVFFMLRIVPGDIKPPMKAYLWALQNPRITAVVSNLWDEAHVRDNLSLAGKKVDFNPA